MLRNTYFKDDETGGLLKREEIDDKYKWNLKDIYESDEKWEEDFNEVSSLLSKYQDFKQLDLSKKINFKELLLFDEKVGIRFDRLHLYSFLSRDLDLSDSKYQAMSDKIQNLSTKASNVSAFIRPALIELGKDTIMEMVSEDDDINHYEHYFDNLFRMQEHSLSKEKEEMIALTIPMRNTAYQAFSYFKNADIEYPKTKDSEGNEIQISDGRYLAALYNQDRNFRKRVYRGFYEPIKSHRNMLSALYNGNIKNQIFSTQVRGFKSTREAALKPNNIPLKVYENLVSTVNENLQPLHRWASIKKKLLKVDDFHPYDTYVPVFNKNSKEYSYDEGVDIVKKSLHLLGDEYNEALNTAFDNRWIDVYETKNKRGGAYSSGTSYGVHPYVLLNWNNQMNDVSTLAHEMGHNMHSFFTEKYQQYVYADYPIFLAEVASITNEALLMNYLIENATDKNEKLALIEMYLTKIVTTFYRQTRFAEYEQLTHERVERGESLTADDLCSIYSDMYWKYWGPEMVVDEEESYTWARVPHFYYGFYVYQYATGLAAGELIAKNIKENGKPAVNQLMQFLKAGKSKYAIETLKDAGVDMSKPEPIKAVVETMNNLLDEVESLI